MYHIHAGTHGSQKRASDSLGLELLIALSHLRWILRTKLRSFAKSSLMAGPPLQTPGSLFFFLSFIFICLHAYMYIGTSHAPITHTQIKFNNNKRKHLQLFSPLKTCNYSTPKILNSVKSSYSPSIIRYLDFTNTGLNIKLRKALCIAYVYTFM